MTYILILFILIFCPFGVLIMLYYSLKRKLEQDECEHKNTFTQVDSVVVTCETTTITCLDCGKRLSTKTEC